ncbi:predicted protein [Nematostella vectensis]|uniref:Uncharacterized protein n=1 Tax=Nematostella vectensis TaxID=45351 RepID=A7S2F5_NEMVE|nr:predicted protein [Nematostella vectensis]|eukprot:XP_001634203.1 predicted protein [Nematostella vectensis]
MAIFGATWPVLANNLISDFSRLHEDVRGIQGLLGNWVESNSARKNKRDRLAQELEELQDRVEESITARENKNLPEPEEMTLEEKLVVFLNWRDELQILHSSIGRSLELARRMRYNKRRDDVVELQEVYDELTDYLCETDRLHQMAQERLEEIQNSNEPHRWRGEHGRDDTRGSRGYYSDPREPPRDRQRTTRSPDPSPSRYFEQRRHRQPMGLARGKKILLDIVNDAEQIRHDSTETSLRMENEDELEERYTHLRDVARDRHRRLLDSSRLFNFLREADELGAWVEEKEAIVSSDDCGRDLEHVEMLMQKFEVFTRDLVSSGERIAKLTEHAQMLLDDEHTDSEVERLKSKSIQMAKDLVAMNRVIEHQKEQLVELTRMKNENRRAERELQEDWYEKDEDSLGFSNGRRN